jgi:hypothetical protein
MPGSVVSGTLNSAVLQIHGQTKEWYSKTLMKLFQVRSPEVLSFCTHHILKCTDSYFLRLPHHDKTIASLVLYFLFFNCLSGWGHEISCHFLLAHCGYATRLILLPVLLIKCDT